MSSLRSTNTDTYGQEWRALDGSKGDYDPSRFADILEEARRGIRRYRMSDVEVRLVDAGGAALAGIPVVVEQKRHEFPFGDQLWDLQVRYRDGEGESGRTRAWRDRFAEVFSAANSLCYWTERPRNDGPKVEDRQGEWRLEDFSEAVDWTLASGMSAKGHPLFWSIPKCVPEWVKRYDYVTQMKFAEVRVRNIVARFKGRVKIWDAVNEPMWEAAFKNLANRQWPHIEPISSIVEYIEPVLRWCREEDPDATYLVNDYGMTQDMREKALTGNDGSLVTAASQRRRYVALLRALADRGVAPDAVGLQSHTGWVGHDVQWRVYDEIAQAGLPVHITEFWASTADLEKSGRYSREALAELVAEYVGNFLTTSFGHPSTGGFFFWGFMSSAVRWHGERSGHETAPVYDRVKSLIRQEWWTREELRTDAEGAVRFRGFHGDYAVRYALGPAMGKGLTFKVAKGSANRYDLVAVPGPR